MTSPSSPGAAVLRADDPLTTKEGWRRFAEHQPQPPELLATADLDRLTAAERGEYDEERKDYHADLPMVNTPVIQKVIATSRLLIQLNRHQVSARRGVIISGASGTGKTTALTQLGRTHELHVRKRHPGDQYRLPVLYVTVPPAATARMLAVEFARFLGLEFTTRANITDIVNAVCATAAHTHVELVCIDELHNLNLATRTGADVSDQLKYFAERLPATFVYADIEVEAQGLFAGVRGRQIAGRFTVIPAAPFSYGTGEQREQWRALIATLESLLRLHCHRPGTLVGLAEYLFPELRVPEPDWQAWRHQSQPCCPRCDARHDGGPVTRLLPHHRYVCTRHKYWIGPPDAGQPATPLGPELDGIVQAQWRPCACSAASAPPSPTTQC